MAKMNGLDFALAVLTNDVVIDNVGVGAVAMATGWDEARLCRLISRTAAEVKARGFTTTDKDGDEMDWVGDWIPTPRQHDPHLQHPDDHICIRGGRGEGRGTGWLGRRIVPLNYGWHLGAVAYWADLADTYNEGGRS